VLPVAEVFWSIQGEGVHTGKPFLFIRLAGCNVGQYAGKDPAVPFYVQSQDLPLYQSHKHSMCESVIGEKFLCDTDYRMKEKVSLVELLEGRADFLHICITGGEPMLHEEVLLGEITKLKASPLVPYAFHMETSGTLPLGNFRKRWEEIYGADTMWFTCSPKKGYLEANAPFINEYKVLVGPTFNLQHLEQTMGCDPGTPWNPGVPVYIQGIQGVQEQDKEGTIKCLEILKLRPWWRLAAQLHKFLDLP
jgi:7-carboxy-7-deazaguanine synthase